MTKSPPVRRLCLNELGDVVFVILNPSTCVTLGEGKGLAWWLMVTIREESHRANKLEYRDSSCSARLGRD